MTCSVFIATSLDGYIARANDDLDWLPANGEGAEGEDHGYVEFFASVDALVVGRRTLEKVLTFSTWPYGDTPVVVLSGRTTGLPPLPVPTAEYLHATPHEIVERLAARGAQHLYVDGGITIQRFLDAGLIDRMTITRIPIILGAGVPLFGPVHRDIHLRHVWTRTYPSGFVQSQYEVLR